jgi:hypothetical protein
VARDQHRRWHGLTISFFSQGGELERRLQASVDDVRGEVSSSLARMVSEESIEAMAERVHASATKAKLKKAVAELEARVEAAAQEHQRAVQGGEERREGGGVQCVVCHERHEQGSAVRCTVGPGLHGS